MKKLEALLFELSQKDVHLWLEGDRLRYRAAKDTITPELLTEIKECKLEIIKFLRQVTQDQSSETLPIVKIDRSGSLPLSFAQQRLWSLHQFEPNSSANNMPIVVKFTGSLKTDALKKSFQSLIQRHEVLRTNFRTENGQSTLVISPEVDIELPVIDLRHLSTEERSSESMRIATQEARIAFDLTNDAMIRLLLLHMSDDEYLLAWNMHTIVCDGASSDVIFRDLVTFYRAFSSGDSPNLPELPVQYVDFAHWQRQWLQGEVLESQINYWKQKLTGSISTVKLPTDHPRPPKVLTYNGERSGKLMSTELNDSLNNLGRKLGGTLFMILIATFEILLHRYSQQNDILITFASAGRSDTEMEGLVGFFSNTLIQRINFDGNPTFRELFARVREASLEANSHQDLPFEKLIEELPVEMSYSRSPLFQIKFALNPPWTNGRGQGAVKLPDLTITSLWGHTYHGKTKHDLMLVMREHDAGLGMVFDYNADIFEQRTIVRMLGHYENLLQGIVANPDQRISEMQLLTDLERNQILHEWNANNVPIPETCIHHLFTTQVERYPDKIAVISKDENLTYNELNSRANQLAHYLQSQGVTTETLVAICLDRSVQMLVGILGILKAGGTYIPLDPSYPHERRINKLRNAQISLILAQSDMISSLLDCGARVLFLDEVHEAISQHSINNPVSSVSADNLAYVIYTSGSTGQPKGVTISHRSMVNHSLAVSKEYELNRQDRVLHFSNISFDVAIEEIFPTFLTGSTLVLAPSEAYTSVTYFINLLQEQAITVINLPTAFWSELVHGLSILNQALPESLRLVIVGGEKVSKSTYQKWRSLVGDFPRWLNAYGPTEATVTATIYDPLKSAESLLTDAEIPIGRAIANLQTYILDRNLQPSPIGVAGELYIGGVGLSRGYLNRPDITVKRFIPNPFSKNSLDRLYKTGDTARYLPDGNIEFIGREDFQIKIRGFRVEPIEIETQLEKHPGVKQAIVLCHESLNGEKFLVAYLSTELDQNIDIDVLGGFLRQRIPAYMLPSKFVVLDALPLTPNGKVDHLALIELDTAQQQEERVISPRDELEQKLADIWEKLLGIQDISIHANFFDLGGNSLLSIRLVSEIEKTFNWNFPLSSFSQINSIAEIAQKIRETPTETLSTDDLTLDLSIEDYRALLAQSIGKVGLRAGKRGLIINILPESQVSSNPFVWIGEVKTGQMLKLKRPVYVMPGASLSPSMKCHEDYISVIASLLVDELISAQPSSTYSLGGWCYNGLVAMEMAQQLKKLGKEVELLTLIDVSGGSKVYESIKDAELYLGTLRFHLFNLTKLSLKGKIQYFTSRISKIIKSIQGKLSVPNFVKNDSSNLDDSQATNHKKEIDIAVDLLEKPSKEYSRKPYDGNVLLIDGSAQIIYGQKELKRLNLFWLFPYNGFGNLLQGKVYVSKIKCDHLELMQEPYCSEISEIIKLHHQMKL
jgi:amino acid adenylation domain-containing protein